ncbi:M48 family metalloprotease [Natronobacterium texcoconense]|uniref:Protease HtpX homolog n=1 Tax=Natronobacterium texcoconense TaxID=1095778 RepID=A0A1H1IBH4_NATTX|nr:Heat shock protein. Metallo peptidase. MEROPS family M48B [Natronobacterium texcoconense]
MLVASVSDTLESAIPGPERQLRIRMVVALVLIALLPFAFVYTFLFLANTVGIALISLEDPRSSSGFGIDPILLTVVVLGGIAIQYRYGPRAILGSVGARRVERDEYPNLHATVNRLSTQIDLPTPGVAVVHSNVPNAFAVDGGDRARVVVTTGLLETLDDEELEAVVAHELAHLRNRDANLMTVAWLLPTITYYLAVVAFYVLYGLFQALGSTRTWTRGSSDKRGLVYATVIITICAVLTMTVSAMFWFASVLLYRVLSRHREYAADRAAATITGSPAALASALEKLAETMPDQPDEDLRELDGGAEALYLAPLEDRAFGSKELVSTDIFPDTHPPTEERIERLRNLARDEL